MFDQEAIDAYNERLKEEAERKEELSATKEVADNVDSVRRAVEYQTARLISDKKVNPQKVQVLNKLATPDDIQKVVTSLNNLAVVLKPEVNDDGPVIEAINGLREQLAKLPSEMPEVEPVEAVTVKNIAEFKNFLQPLITATNELVTSIQKLKLDPVYKPIIDVKAPQVVVPQIDTKRIEEIISQREKERSEEIEFSDFVAQDIDNEQELFQYAGLVHPAGYWCVIENSGDSMRYAFGSGKYSTGWKNRGKHSYKLLDEALNDIKA